MYSGKYGLYLSPVIVCYLKVGKVRFAIMFISLYTVLYKKTKSIKTKKSRRFLKWLQGKRLIQW